MKNRANLTFICLIRKEILLLGAAIIGATSVAGQQPSDVKLRFNHLALSVKDVDVSAEFYGRTLNLTELSKEPRTRGVRWFSLSDGNELHLISHEYYEGAPVAINKAVHLALTTNHFEGILKLLDAHKISYGDWKGAAGKVDTRSDGVKQVFLQDPDGYWIEINSAGEK
jgi:lactoylglutathione lyase